MFGPGHSNTEIKRNRFLNIRARPGDVRNVNFLSVLSVVRGVDSTRSPLAGGMFDRRTNPNGFARWRTKGDDRPPGGMRAFRRSTVDD